jgi:hypothetical protein
MPERARVNHLQQAVPVGEKYDYQVNVIAPPTRGPT